MCRPGCAAVLEFAQVEVKPQLQKKTASFDKSLCALCILEVQITVDRHYFIVTSESTHVTHVSHFQRICCPIDTGDVLDKSLQSWEMRRWQKRPGRSIASPKPRFHTKTPKTNLQKSENKRQKNNPPAKSSRFCTDETSHRNIY